MGESTGSEQPGGASDEAPAEENQPESESGEDASRSFAQRFEAQSRNPRIALTEAPVVNRAVGSIRLLVADVIWGKDQVRFELVDEFGQAYTVVPHTPVPGSDAEVDVTLPGGMAVGVYTLRMTVSQGETVLAESDIDFVLTTTLQVQPAVIRSFELPREIIVTGSGLQLSLESQVPVTFTDASGGSFVLHSTTVYPDDTLYLTLPSDMAPGEYTVSVTSNGVPVEGDLEIVDDPGISVAQPLPGDLANIGITITGSAIRAGAQVSVHLESSQGGDPIPLDVSGPVRDGVVNVVIRTPLASGNYTLVVTVDGKRHTLPVRVEARPHFVELTSFHPASYSERVVRLRGGDRWTFAPDSMPQIRIVEDRTDVVVQTLQPRFVSEKEVEITFPAGLRSGDYKLTASMDPYYAYSLLLHIGLDLAPALQPGVPSQTVTGTAAGVTFEEGTTVSVDRPGVTVSGVQVLESGNQIRFTINGELPREMVKIIVTKPDGYTITHGAYVGFTPSLPRTATLTDWNGHAMPGVKVWISRADEYPVKSSGFTTGADGSFTLSLSEGQYIVNWWEDGTGRRNRTYLPFTITAGQTQYELRLPAPNVTLYVQDDRGNAVPDARVWIMGLSQNDPLRGEGIDTTSDANGTAQLYLPPAEYKVGSVEVAGYLPGEWPQFVVQSAGVKEVYITLKRPNVMGTVRFAGDETEPVAWARVVFHAESGWYGRTTDANGLLAYDLNPGETYYLAEVVLSEEQGSHQYYFGKRHPVPLEDADDWVTLDVELPALNVQGDAVIAGRPVAEGTLLILPDGEYWPLEVPIRDGRWQLYLTAGDYSITGIRVDGHTFETAWLIGVEDGQTLPGITVQPTPVQVPAGVALANEPISLPAYQPQLGDSAVLTLRNASGPVAGVQAALVSAGDYEVVIGLTGTLAPGWYVLHAADGTQQYEWALEARETPNLQAVLRDRTGNPVRNAWVDVVLASEWPRHGDDSFQTDQDGRLTASLPVGDYVIYRWHSGGRTQATYIPVKITSATDYRANPGELKEPDHTLFIRIYDESGSPAAGAQLVIRRHDGDGPIQYGTIDPVTDDTGLASMYLPPGYYWVESVFTTSTRHVGMRLTIDASGQMLNENNEPVDELEIRLTPYNFEGSVLINGQPARNVHLVFQAADDHQVSTTGEDGRFRAQLLPNRTYYVDQVTYGQGRNTLRWRLGTMFRIDVDEQGVPNPEFLPLVLPDMNVRGQAQVGNLPVPEGYVIMSSAAEPGRNIEVHVWDGDWTIFLPDGEYRIHQLVVGERIYPTDIRFTVSGGAASPYHIDVAPMRTNVHGEARNQFGQGIHYGWIQFRSDAQVVYAPVSEGQYQVYLDPAQTWHAYSVADGPDRFELDPPVSITVGVRNDIAVPRPTLAATIRDEADRLMPLVQVVIRGEGQEYWATSDMHGQIAVNLPPGTYEIAGWQYGRPLVFDTQVIGGSEPFPSVLRVSVPNVTGTVLAEDGSAAEHASLRVVNAVTGGEVVLRADSQGRFGARLEGGFCIREVTGRSYWFRSNTCFTAKAGEPVDLVVRPRAANVNGTVRTADGQPIAYAQVGFRDAFGEAVWTRADDKGQFRLALEPGWHQVVAVGAAAGWVEVRHDIDVPADGTLTVDVVWPPTTAAGRVQQVNGQPMRYASVLFTSTLPGVADVRSQADGSGQFSAALPAGEWLVAGIFDPEARMFHSLENRALRIVVEPDQAAPVNVGVLRPLTPNVSGRVYADRARTTVVRDSWLMITSDEPTGQNIRTYWAKTNELGDFSLYLEPGRYVVRSVAGESGYVLNLRFAVPTGQLTVVPPEVYVEGRVDLPGVTGPAQVAIRPVVDGHVSPDAASTLWIATEADGTWRAVLADGTYAVVAVDTADGRHAVEVQFEVKGGTAPEVVVTQ